MMYDSMRNLAYELMAGLIQVPGLRSINFADPCQTKDFDRLKEEIPDWPEILIDLLCVFNGVEFFPDRGRFFNVDEILLKHEYIRNLEGIPETFLPVIFGELRPGQLLALHADPGTLPGQESILVIPENHFIHRTCFPQNEQDIFQFQPGSYRIGTGFNTWLDNWIENLRREAEFGLMGGLTSFFSAKRK